MPTTTIRLRDKDISKLSIVLNIPEETLVFLKCKGLLDDNECRNELILYDYKKLKALQQPKLKPGRIIQILADEYCVPSNKIRLIVPSNKTRLVVYNKKEKQYSCSSCGTLISKDEHLKNEGKCELCVQKMINKALEPKE